jgi:hypothetical protein
MEHMKEQNRRNFLKTIFLSIGGVLGIKFASRDDLARHEEGPKEIDIKDAKEAEFYSPHNLAG